MKLVTVSCVCAIALSMFVEYIMCLQFCPTLAWVIDTLTLFKDILKTKETAVYVTKDE